MKVLKYLPIVLVGVFLFVACEKEFSIESGFAGKVATGSLLDTADNCKDIVVNGSYIIDSTLTDSNYVTVQVNFATGGSYRIFSDTQNGFSFQDSGFSAAGVHTIKLKATGRPVTARQTTFQVAFDTTFCSFTVNVIGNNPAAYTLIPASNGKCANVTINGTYATGTALNAGHTLTLQVAVTSIGSYSVTTGPINGITFSGTGNLTTTGLQIITLQGRGTPLTAGNFDFPVTAGNSSCSFTVPVVAGGGGGNTDPNLQDTAWRFTQGTNSFNGFFYDVFDTTINNNYAVVFIGFTAATTDTLMYMGASFNGGSIQPGTYGTHTSSFFNFTDIRDTANAVTIYDAQPKQTPQAAQLQITISSYDPATKIITGTFTGTVMSASNSSVPVSNGRFRARVR